MVQIYDRALSDTEVNELHILLDSTIAAGSVVADVTSVIDQDIGDRYSFALTDDAGGKFAIDANTGDITLVADHDASTAYSDTVPVQVTDAGGNTFTETISINLGTEGTDSLTGTDGTDIMYGFGGGDTLNGGAGDDYIVSGSVATAASASESLNFSLQGADGTDLSGGFTQDTGDMNVSVTISNDGVLKDAEVETNINTYVGAGEPFDPNSSLFLRSTGGGNIATATFDSTAEQGSGLSDSVENVQFRINDIDSSSWTDVVSIRAFDADGNPLSVT